jgi:(p)ppGpp synthase/HD superfamily hydrolase
MDVQMQRARTAFVRRFPRTRAALAFADERHAGQRRKTDGAPFMMHPVEVACLLQEAGHADHVVAAGVLHDVLEDTDAERGELEERFGPAVAALVSALTDDPTIRDEVERKAALRLQVAEAGRDAAAIFAADKVSKARELRLLASRGELGPRARMKIEHYRESLGMLAPIIPGHDLVVQLQMELDAIAAMPVSGV